jgi:sirohydrochlorin ferrochelatase
MKKAFICVTLLALSWMRGAAWGQGSGTTGAQQKAQRTGILLLAHGGALQWNEDVRHVADQADLSLPTEVAFGMATKSTMQSAISRLEGRGVTEIVAVPLFVSSHSSVIDSTAYLLGLRAQMPEDLKMFATMDHSGGSMDHSAMHDPAKTADALKPISSSVPIRMASALDHHAIVADILKDRAASISRVPAHEVVILVAHGPVPDDENKLWLRDMSILAEQMRKETQYADIQCLTLRDDADDPVRSTATEQLREKAKQVTQKGNTALIVPLLLSYGGIEDGIRKRLSGLTYHMSTQGLLPDTRVVTWVVDAAHSNAAQMAQSQH